MATTGSDKNRFFPDGERLKEAAIGALVDPYTWAPALGAAAFGVNNLDNEVSDWASENTPVFGSNHDARVASDTTPVITNVGMYLTALLAKGDNDEVALDVGKRIVVETLAVGATATITKAMKEGVGRTRPDGSDTQSFPSGHSSAAFVAATLGRRNLEYIDMTQTMRYVTGAGFTALAATTAWARVEGGVHYPSDVLFGAALGNFLGVFVHGAFIGGVAEESLAIGATPTQGGILMTVTMRY